jgi:hypothetical protein
LWNEKHGERLAHPPGPGSRTREVTKMKFVLRAAVMILTATTLLDASSSDRGHRDQSQIQPAKTIVVILKKLQGRVTYEVDSKYVNDPIAPLEELLKQRGEDCPVIVLFPWDITFKEELDVNLIAGKAGFKTIRSFVYSRDKGYMSELKLGVSIPYTTNPPLN